MADASVPLPAAPQGEPSEAQGEAPRVNTLSLCVFDRPDPASIAEKNVWEIGPCVDYSSPERHYAGWKALLSEVLADMNRSGFSSYRVTGRAPLTLMMQVGAALGVGKEVSMGGHAVPGFVGAIGPHPGLDPPMATYTYIPRSQAYLEVVEADPEEAHVLFLGTEQRGGDFTRVGYRGISVSGVVQSVSTVGLRNDHVYGPETAEDLCAQLRMGIDNALNAIIANHGHGLMELRLLVVSSLAAPLSLTAGRCLRKSVRPTCFAEVGLVDRVGTDYVFAGNLD